jgi:hypothetical protein
VALVAPVLSNPRQLAVLVVRFRLETALIQKIAADAATAV